MERPNNRSEESESDFVREGLPGAHPSRMFRGSLGNIAVATLPPPESEKHGPRVIRPWLNIHEEPIRIEDFWIVPDLRVTEHSTRGDVRGGPPIWFQTDPMFVKMVVP